MEEIPESYRDFIQENFNVRKEVNPQYSLRSFAKDLDMLPGNLSSVMSGRQGLSQESALKIAKKLKLSESETNLFVNLVLAKDARSKKEKLAALKRLNSLKKEDKKVLNDDYFKIISEWYYYAILEMVTTDNFNSDHFVIAKQLGLDPLTVNKAMQRLVRLGLIVEEDGKYKTTNAQLETPNDIPSHYVKKHNMQFLKKASDALLGQDVKTREMSTLTIAINDEDIDFVKQRIRNFKRELDKDLMKRTAKDGASKVYGLGIQFFNLLEGDVQ